MFLLTALALTCTFTLFGSGGAHAAVGPGPQPETCTGFSLAGLSGVAIAERTYYPANASVQISNDYIAMGSSSLPAFCRLQLVITTNATAGSVANTEVWLPDAWNERMLTVGGGGLAGGADVLALSLQVLPQGFAGVSTNGGHNSSALDGTWGGPRNDNALIDYGWRAMHLSVVAGKEVVRQYYAQKSKGSYYMGCSNGGRQGLQEIQRFPDSFDGAVVGSPANWMTRLATWGAHLALLVQPATSSRFISQDMWTDVIGPEVMKQCDALDGVSDNVINDPRLCHFRPETLACRPSQDPATCLNPDQIAALRHIYADYFEGGTYVFGGLNPGGEDVYPTAYLGATPSALPIAWMQYMVFNDTTWTLDEFNSSTFRIADEVDAGQVNAINPDLSAFAAAPHNGKILHYVGLTDELISPRNSFHYYDTVLEHARRSGGAVDVDEFYRLFPVPGMNHCFGGHGANMFGGLFQLPGEHDAEHDILAAMIRWVEEGVAPTKIIAAKYNNDTEADGLAFTRPLCKHPLTAKFVGGDQNDASSFECA